MALRDMRQYSHQHDASTTGGWDTKDSSVASYKQQYDTSVSRAHDATLALNRKAEEARNVQITSGYSESESQTILPSAGAAERPGSAAVRPGGTLGQFAGQAPMSAGTARSIVSEGNQAAVSGNWAGNRVATTQMNAGSAIGAGQVAVRSEQGTVHDLAPGYARSLHVKTRQLIANEKFGAMDVGGSAWIVGRHVKAKAMAVGTSSVITVAENGGVEPDLNPDHPQMKSAMEQSGL